MHKILYVCRLFNGFEQSMIDKIWKPTGVPTIYRVIDRLNESDIDLKVIMTVKDGFMSYQPQHKCEIHFESFSNPVTILHNQAGNRPLKLLKIWRELVHFLHILLQFCLYKPDIVYLDHANVWTAGLLARFSSTPIVFRLMGVYPSMRQIVHSKGLQFPQRFLRWLYKSPFDLVIATQDGSGVERWTDAVLDKNVPVKILLNGLPEPRKARKLIDNRKTINIIFIGKLEKAKGAEEFTQAMIMLANQANHSYKFTIVGFGSLQNKLKKCVVDSGHNALFNFIERVENKKINALLRSSDIYVSMNKLGNLSNANLEAIAAGCCMIIPQSQPSTGVDLFTDKILLGDMVWRLEHGDEKVALFKAVSTLLLDADKLNKMARQVLEVAKELPSWKLRIDNEIDILRKIFHQKDD